MSAMVMFDMSFYVVTPLQKSLVCYNIKTVTLQITSLLWLLHAVCYHGVKAAAGLKSFRGNSGWEVVETSESTYRSVRVNFTVSFPVESCCPFVLLFANSGSRTLTNKPCAVNYEKFLENVSEMVSIVISLEAANSNESSTATHQCIDTGDGNYTCTGSMNGTTYQEDRWDWIVAYDCDANKTVAIDYLVDFSKGSPIRCVKYNVNSAICENLGLDHVHMPSIWSSPDQYHADDLLDALGNLVYSGCHKFVREYNCRIHFTPCNLDDPIRGFPCRELCYEIHKFCPELISKFKELNTCQFYPSRELHPTCYRPEVICPEPRDPNHGSVKFSGVSVGSEATYSCNMLFDLNGETIRACQGSGEWSGKEPYCDAFSDTAVITFALTVIGLLAMVATCIACCCLNSREIKVALYMKFNLSFGKRLTEIHDRIYDVFVIYNHDSDDEWFVINEIIPLLVQHRLHVVTEDCFALGVDCFTCLQNVITQSRTALVVLTPNLLRANWKLYQLNQAVYTQIEQHNLKVVFLQCEKLTCLGNLPKNLRLFLQLQARVEKYKSNWKGSLIYELKHETKRPVNKRLTFGNAGFPRCHRCHINEFTIEVGSSIEVRPSDVACNQL